MNYDTRDKKLAIRVSHEEYIILNALHLEYVKATGTVVSFTEFLRRRILCEDLTADIQEAREVYKH